MKYITVYYKKTKNSYIESLQVFYDGFVVHTEDIDTSILKAVGDVSSAWY
jgi:hypothetical protein